jgi:hypothetical protein
MCLLITNRGYSDSTRRLGDIVTYELVDFTRIRATAPVHILQSVRRLVPKGCKTQPDAVRQAAHAVLPPAVDHVPDLIPYGGQARKALELTFRQALRLGHNYIGTEHILLALLELEAGTGALTGLGIDKAAAEAAVTTALAAIRGEHERGD